MSAELARHLLQTGNIAPEEVHAALLDVVTLGVPFVQALVSRGSAIGERLEAELSRLRVPTLRSVRVARDIATRLPNGMCARLLAVPVGRSSDGEVEVACVDPLDPAIGVEFSHQLKCPVRIVRATLSELLIAIERWLDEREAGRPASALTPAFGTSRTTQGVEDGLGYALGRVLRDDDAATAAGDTASHEDLVGAAFPLVRRSIPPPRPTTNPGLGELTAALDDAPPDSTGQPVISLTRSKPLPAATASESVHEATALSPARDEPLALDRLDEAQSPDALVLELSRLAGPFARFAWVMALRAGVHETRAASGALAASVEALRVVSGPQSVLDLAVLDGHFLGHLPEDDAHRALREAIGGLEVYAVPIVVSGRPTLTLLLAGFDSSLSVSRTADALAARAGAVLERIVRDRKRGSSG